MIARVSKDKTVARRGPKQKVEAPKPTRRAGVVKKVRKAEVEPEEVEELDVSFTGLLDDADLFADEAVASSLAHSAKGAEAAVFFDGLWYLATYPDVRDAGIEPLEHFLTHGLQEGRNPNALFDAQAYVQANPDIAAFPFGAFMHYVCFGFHEKRPLR
ncbi:MAG: hypothetical protein LKI03_06465 [Acetobacter indonesiensis]|jgi:hypothetical protein|nr:hypothetical protein [Acetobacter indonesiensis]MCI1546336.1 hypothetical protein [Acetobacter indonesiensis]MCI1765674.1 hypothetical protein [Acetobacter indonesiensis]